MPFVHSIRFFLGTAILEALPKVHVLQFTEAVLTSESIMCTFGSASSIAVPKKYLIECIIGM